jgi:hypothetical protein
MELKIEKNIPVSHENTKALARVRRIAVEAAPQRKNRPQRRFEFKASDDLGWPVVTLIHTFVGSVQFSDASFLERRWDA